MIQQMFMMKFHHKMDMDVTQEENKLIIARQKAKEGRAEDAQKRKETRKEARDVPKTYILDGEKFAAVGGKLTRIKPTQKGLSKYWSQSEQRYVRLTPEQALARQDDLGMTKKTAIEMRKAGAAKISIGEKQKQRDAALLKSPKFMATVQKDVKNLNGRRWKWASPVQKAEWAKVEADKRVRIIYPDAQYGEQDGQAGWYVKDESGNYVLEVPWSK